MQWLNLLVLFKIRTTLKIYDIQTLFYGYYQDYIQKYVTVYYKCFIVNRAINTLFSQQFVWHPNRETKMLKRIGTILYQEFAEPGVQPHNWISTMHNGDVTWALRHLKSLVICLFIQQGIEANTK